MTRWEVGTEPPRPHVARVLALAVLVAVLVVPGFIPRSTNAAVNAPSHPSVVDVDIVDFAFQPAEITVSPGTTVRWTNRGSAVHSVAGSGFNSGDLQPGASFSHVFAALGRYAYHCALHPSMTGSVQ